MINPSRLNKDYMEFHTMTLEGCLGFRFKGLNTSLIQDGFLKKFRILHQLSWQVLIRIQVELRQYQGNVILEYSYRIKRWFFRGHTKRFKM